MQVFVQILSYRFPFFSVSCVPKPVTQDVTAALITNMIGVDPSHVIARPLEETIEATCHKFLCQDLFIVVFWVVCCQDLLQQCYAFCSWNVTVLWWWYFGDPNHDRFIPVSKVEGVSLTFLDAGHCPGSAMVAFEVNGSACVQEPAKFRTLSKYARNLHICTQSCCVSKADGTEGVVLHTGSWWFALNQAVLQYNQQVASSEST